MKKLLILILAFALALSLASCGEGSKTTANDQTEEVADNGAVTDEGEDMPESEAADEIEEASADKQTNTQVEFAELTVVDNEECTIKITGIDPDNTWGYTLKAYLENKSAEKTYMFSVESAAVNGVQTDPFFASEVAAGKKSNDNISFNSSTLEENGIVEYTDIELTFRVYDGDDWATDAVALETVHIYPYGEENATIFVREPQSTDTTIVDNEYVTVTVTGYEIDGIWGYTVNLFLINKTDTEIMFSTDEVSVNGYMADPFWASSVLPGKCAFSSMSWSDSTFEENGITDVEEIELLMRARDYDDWLADDFSNERVILNP